MGLLPNWMVVGPSLSPRTGLCLRGGPGRAARLSPAGDAQGVGWSGIKGLDNDASSRADGAQIEPPDEARDHIRGAGATVLVEYGDYECPYSRAAYRSIQAVERRANGALRFVFRHFPLTEIHPHALAASQAAEAASSQERFWQMHDVLFHRQKALEDADLRAYAAELGLDLERFDQDRASQDALERIARDVKSGEASGQVLGTPTLFIDGVVYRGSYDVETLMERLIGSTHD